MQFEGAITFAAVGALGGVARSILGWANSKEKFEIKKFVKSLIRSCIGGMLVAFFFGFGMKETFLSAFVIDVGSKEGFSALMSKVKPK